LKRYGLSDPRELPLPLAIIIAEELREGVEEAIGRLGKPLSTYVVDHRMLRLSGSREMLDLRGRGTLRELIIISEDPNLLISLEADDRQIINHRLLELMDVSELLEDVDVFERNGSHVFRISSVHFLSGLRNILVPLNPSSQVTVKRYFALYDVES
jgi:hypothetical protein